MNLRITIVSAGLISIALHAQAPAPTAPEPVFTPAFKNQTKAPQPAKPSQYAVETVASGLVQPWSLAFMPDGRMLVTERAGQIRIIDRTGELSDPLRGVPGVRIVGGHGLTDIALDPQFAQNRILYFTLFAPPAGKPPGPMPAPQYQEWLMRPPADRLKDPFGIERLVRARLSADEKSLEDLKVMLEGGDRRIVMANDGTMFVTAAAQVSGGNIPIDDLPQRLDNPYGKVLRINRDGSIPRDNPFVGKAGARAEIYTFGVRDPEGAAINPATGQLWTVEHGVKGGDELNIARRGANNGYPVINYGVQYSGEKIGEGITAKKGMEQPLYYWNPDIGPSGMLFYTGNLFPEWKGNLFIGALPAKHLVRLVLKGERMIAEERLLVDLDQRIRDVRQGPDQALYVLTSEDNGRLLRIVPKR